MTFTVCDAEQRSPEWFAARCGLLTGSRASDMLATIKSGEAAARRDLRVQLIVERLTGRTQDDGFVNDAMQHGIDCEPQAFSAYEALTGVMARRVGFLTSNTCAAGCSPDGVIGDFQGLLELKCPKSATHWRYLRGDQVLPSEHVPQVTHNLWISGAAWCDFLSFDPRFPPAYQTFLVRVQRDDLDIGAYERKALAFLEEVEREIASTKGFGILEEAQP